MRWRRQWRDTRDDLVQEPDEQIAINRLERRCNELGAQGWELVSTLPLSRLAFSSGGRATGTQLFLNWRLP